MRERESVGGVLGEGRGRERKGTGKTQNKSPNKKAWRVKIKMNDKSQTWFNLSGCE